MQLKELLKKVENRARLDLERLMCVHSTSLFQKSCGLADFSPLVNELPKTLWIMKQLLALMFHVEIIRLFT